MKNYNERLVKPSLEDRKSCKNAKKVLVIEKRLIVALENDNIRLTGKK